MKADLSELDEFRAGPSRVVDSSEDAVYTLPYREGEIMLNIITSELHDKDRVSVVTRCYRPLRRNNTMVREPTLAELRFVRKKFFEKDDSVRIELSEEGNSKSKAIELVRDQN
tara:strand:+ start:2162 stop:2500 length:339 start_codon:yes stop_codon:yes gene_type:complete